MARMPQRRDYFDEPNVILPLAASYNERGGNGYAASITNRQDQLKVNCFYEQIQNSQTGRTTLYLRKRMGFGAIQALGYVTASDAPYLLVDAPTADAYPWVFALKGISTNVYNDTASTHILASTGHWPRFVDRTMLSGVQHTVLQIYQQGSSAPLSRTYYASSIGTFDTITSATYTTMVHRGKMEHLDGYGFQMTVSNRIHNSGLNTLSTWGAADYITKSIEQDAAIGLARNGRVLLAFGTETVEGFYNAGNTVGSPLGRIPGLSARYGLGGAQLGTYIPTPSPRHYYTTIGKVIYFLGTESMPQWNQGGGVLGLFAFDGSQFGRVSTPAVDRIISNASGFGFHVCNMQVSGDLAVAVALTVPTTATQIWLMYIPRLKEWFEWRSTGVQPVSNGYYTLGIGGVAAAASYYIPYPNGNWEDTGSTYTMQHQFKLPRRGSGVKRAQMIGVIGDTSSSAGLLQVALSRDDYQTFETARDIDMTKIRKELFRCGAFRDLSVRISHSSNADCRLESFIARIE